jgi:hypothetical protein
MMIRLLVLRAGGNFPQEIYSGTLFCYRMSKCQGQGGAGRIRKIEKFIDLIGIGASGLPDCSIGPQLSMLTSATMILC